MPSLEEHIAGSKRRTKERYMKVHEWVDGEKISLLEKLRRHITIRKTAREVRQSFGKEAVGEYLRHIEADYKQNFLLRFLWILVMKIRFPKYGK